MEVNKIGVVGVGVMGQGIIQVFAQNGFTVFFYDTQQEQMARAEESILKRLKRRQEKGEIDEQELSEISGRIKKVSALKEMKEVDLVLEAVSEEYNIKTRVFRKLAEVCPPEVIFATNTSSISITKLAKASKRPEKLVGMHFMNPPTLVSLIELIRGEETSDETFNQVLEISKRIKREVIIKSKDRPAFICNRILLTAINEAIWAVNESLGSVEDINSSVLLGVGTSKSMPVLRLADLIGLDICLDVLKIMHKGLGKKYMPSPFLEKMVNNGHLGRKSGQGFFEYKK